MLLGKKPRKLTCDTMLLTKYRFCSYFKTHKKIFNKKCPGPDGLADDFCQKLNEELTPVFSRLPKNLTREILQTHSLKPSITLLPNLSKYYKKTID